MQTNATREAETPGSRVSERPWLLASSYSFAPRQGSEPGTGWAFVHELAREFRVAVVCADYYSEAFRDADFAALRERGVVAHFFRAPAARILLPLGGGLPRLAYYSHWQRAARGLFERLERELQPVAAVHLTWANGRAFSSMRHLSVPVVYGPVGGFESGCRAISDRLGGRSAWTERLRCRAIEQARSSRRLASMYAGFRRTLATSPESRAAISALGGREVELLSNSGVHPSVLEELERRRERSVVAGRFRWLFVGRLAGWKGEELALRALARLRGREWEATFVGGGRNLEAMRGLARQLGVEEQVRFTGAIDQNEVWDHYAAASAFVYPSLHDSGGNAVLEAMGAGLPVVCLKLGGPGWYVDDACGFRVEPGDFDETIERLGAAMEGLMEDDGRCRDMGLAAARRCRDTFTWRVLGERLLKTVRCAIAEVPADPLAHPRAEP